MESTIKQNDTVKLISGGEPMTVISIRGINADCTWHDKDRKPQFATYPLATLKKWPDVLPGATIKPLI